MHVPPDQDHAIILVVDDQPTVVAAVRLMLASRPKWVVHAVGTFSEALDAAIRLRPQVILQDMLLPDGNGLDLVERYVACRELPGVQVIVLSGDEKPENKAAAFDAGAFDYIVKMPSQAEFVVRVRHAVRQSSMVGTQVRLLDEAEAANRRAERQLQAREQATFASWDDLRQRVRGIGTAKAANLSAQGLTVSGAAYAATDSDLAASQPKKRETSSARASVSDSPRSINSQVNGASNSR